MAIIEFAAVTVISGILLLVASLREQGTAYQSIAGMWKLYALHAFGVRIPPIVDFVMGVL